MSNLNMETLVVRPLEVNCYLVWDDADKIGVVIDPGDEDERIIEVIESHGVDPKAILLTHGHGDHIAAVEPIKEKYKVPIYLGDGDQNLLSKPSANMSAFYGQPITCPPADKILHDKDVFIIGSLEFNVIATPGHSPGGICYLVRDHLYCGDTLFYGSIGRTDLPGGSYKQLIDSIDKNLLGLPENMVCYPGHGPFTTIGAEKHNNPFLTGNRFV